MSRTDEMQRVFSLCPRHNPAEAATPAAGDGARKT